MLTFKKIYYPKMLLETLRGFSINKAQKLSVIYKICFACLFNFQNKWDLFDNTNPSIENILKSRRSLMLIANCRWITGEVENLLNYLFPSPSGQITISNTSTVPIHYLNNFDDTPSLDPVYLNNFDGTPSLDPVYFLNFNDVVLPQTVAVVNIPFSANSPEYTAIDAVVNMVRLKGVKYIINTN